MGEGGGTAGGDPDPHAAIKTYPGTCRFALHVCGPGRIGLQCNKEQLAPEQGRPPRSLGIRPDRTKQLAIISIKENN